MKTGIGRGLLLSAAVTLPLVLAGRIDVLAGYGLSSPFFMAMLVMMIPGAFLASVPGRIRRRKETRLRSTWQGCLMCFLGGAAMLLGAGMAGGGDGMMLAGLCQGSVSAYVFLAVSAAAAFAAARLMGRGRQA